MRARCSSHWSRPFKRARTATARHPSEAAVLEVLLQAYGNLLARFEANPVVPGHVGRHLERAEQLARQRPSAVESRAALGVAFSQAGKVASSAGRIDEALGYFRCNAEIQAEIAVAEPFNATARRNLMLAWSTLADVALGPLGLNSYTGAARAPTSSASDTERTATRRAPSGSS